MRSLLFLFFCLTAAALVSADSPVLPPKATPPPYYTEPNWKISRFVRSADPEPQGSIVFQGQKPLSGPERRPSYNLDYQHNIWEGKNGQVSASGGAIKLPGERVQPHVGIQGTWRFRRSADPEPQGSIVLQGQKPLSGPDRRPTINLDYQHKIWEGQNGHVSASGGAMKLPGQKVQPNFGIQGTWRFRRSADPEPQGSIVFQGQKPLSGPERRPSYNLDYQHNIWQGKNGQVSASGGAIKLPGERIQPHVGIQGTWRFRRSADPEPQGSIVFQGQKPLSGPERRPSYNLDYQHNIWQGKNGQVSASGGAIKLPGERVQPHVGIQGTWRFRRSADPEPQGSIVFQGQKPLSGPERRPSYNLDYQHNIWQGKNGQVSASGGAMKLPGQRVQPHVGIQGTWRFRRSADPEPQGSIVFQGQKPLSGPERRPSYNLDYQHNIWQGKNGQVSASGGAMKLPGQRVQPHVGIQGTWRFRRSADPEPQGSIVFQGQKPLSGPERRPSYNLDYQHNIWQGKNGQVSASGGAIKLPGQRVQPHVGIQGTWRFRRSADPEPQGSIVFQGQKPLSGPERRPSYNLDYQHNIWQGKNGQVSASGGAMKLPGQRVQPHVGIQGSWRFRRSADPEPQGSIVFQGQKPLSGPERRPSYNLDYQHNIWQGKNGQVSASGGAIKLPGERVQPHVGIQGTWRFRRSADPEPQGSIVFQGQKPLSGPERRPSYNLDYQHNIWQGKNGQVSASGGAMKLPGQRVQPHVGIQGTWRFRRSADPEPQGSIVFQGQKPLSGPERRPSYNLDYQHNIWQGKNGQVSASGGAIKLPGERVQPHVGIQGTWRFRRSADPEPQGSIVLQGQKPLSGPERRPSYNLDYQQIFGKERTSKCLRVVEP